jgi:hypothetical protein
MEWVYLGANASDGIFAWLAFGVDLSYVRDVSAAAFLYESGGVTNPDPHSPPHLEANRCAAWRAMVRAMGICCMRRGCAENKQVGELAN